jgi:HTH-type transcriptional regulator, competence development regulator
MKRTHGKKSRLREKKAETLSFGPMLRALRQQRGIGLRQLAARVHISPPYLSNIETGKFPPPSDEKLRLIARELDEDPDKLLAKAGDRIIVDPSCGTASFFGEALRELRQKKGIGLRQLAAKVGISPSYLSNVETAKFPPPSEETLSLIAQELDQHTDQMLAQAGKISSDLPKIIEKHPRQFAAILRSLRGLEESDFVVLVNGLAKQFGGVLADQPSAQKIAVGLPIDWKLLGETFGGDSQARKERNECEAVHIPLRRNKWKDAGLWTGVRDRVRSVEASIDKEMVAAKIALENEGKKKARKPADGVLVRTSS